MLIACHMFAKVMFLSSVEVDVDPGDRQRGAAGQHRPPPHIRLHLDRDEQVCGDSLSMDSKFSHIRIAPRLASEGVPIYTHQLRDLLAAHNSRHNTNN